MIIKTLASGASGMRAFQTKLDTIGNNIANINTTAYKRGRVEFAEMMRQAVGDQGTPAADNPRPAGGSGVKLVTIARLTEQGDLQPTGRDLDLAIQGEGYFKVISPDDDKEYYTRDGCFYLNNEGIIVNGNGYRLEPEINLQDNDYVALRVDEKGIVYGKPADGDWEETGSEINLYTFPAPANLQDEGNNLYSETPTSGENTEVTPGEEGAGLIQQGYLERSNVDLADEMLGMIEAQRAYAANTRTIQTADEMWDRANNLRK